LLLTFSVTTTHVHASILDLQPTDLPLLYGHWQGEILSCDEKDCVRWETGLTLTFKPGPPPLGSWHSESYHADWQTDVMIREGKLLLRYHDLKIPFTLQRFADGSLRLEGSYRGSWLWFPRMNHIRLTKDAGEARPLRKD